ncbi:FAD-dependent monooxygenase [Paramicrobacterium chengjingii]|uniref:FAD-dependent monooxygenase n=1 Tax=Paramicrobacterium chengjingii TaxID=2769067 RepID=UPI00141FABE1|nr:FAD-dependent monooxygenase [Microbacterium chengjingii]
MNHDTSEVHDVDVLLIGAGPTGLTLAVELARRRVDHVLIDREVGSAIGSRGKGLQPRSLEVLDDLGVLDTIIANSTSSMGLRLYQGTQQEFELSTTGTAKTKPGVPHPDLLVLPEWRVEQVLHDLLCEFGGRVERRAELADIEQEESSVLATLVDGRRIRARYLVGCDGGRSTVRRLLGAPMLGQTHADQYFLVGDVKVDGLDDTVSHAWFGEDGSYLALAPLPNADGAWQYQANVLLGPDGVAPEPTLEIFNELFYHRSGRQDVILSEPTWLSGYRFNTRMVANYRFGRVFLAGDAAHVHTPAGGQGMNTGIQDAYNLGWKMAATLTGASEILLDSYELERIPVAKKVLASSARGFDSMFSQRGIRRLIRDHLIFPLVRRPAITSKLLAKTNQLDISYRQSPLTVGTPGFGPRPGDRAPDARLTASDDTPARLFDVLRGTHWTLLGFGDESAAAIRAVKDACPTIHGRVITRRPQGGTDRMASSEAAKLYRARAGELVLIRPDGHIATRTVVPGAVIAFLSGLGTPQLLPVL